MQTAELYGNRVASQIGRLPNIVPADRVETLQRILKVWPSELEDLSIEGRLHVSRMLRGALRAERQRAVARDPDYSVAKHAALLRAFWAEAAALSAMVREIRGEIDALTSGRVRVSA